MITLFVNLDETEQYMVKIDSEFFCICAKTSNQVDKAINNYLHNPPSFSPRCINA